MDQLSRPVAPRGAGDVAGGGSAPSGSDGGRGVRLRLATALLVPLLPALLAAACRGSGEPTASLQVGTFWSGQSAQALQRELIRISRNLGPVSIEVRTFSEAALSDYLSRPQPFAEREPLDLAIVPHDWLGQLSQREIIAELPSERVQFLKQRLVAQALLAVSDGDRVFGYPISAEVLALVYDPTIFPHPPRTLDEVLAMRFPAGVLPFALDISDPGALAPLVGSLQGMLIDSDGNLVWLNGSVTAVLARLRPIWLANSGWRAFRGGDLESLQVQLYAEGKLATFIAGPWLLQALEKSGRPFAVMPVPGFEGARSPARALVGYQCAVISRESRWGDLALEVGSQLLTQETNETINRATRRLPVLLRSYESKQGLMTAGSFGFLRALEEGQFVPGTPHWNEEIQKARHQLKSLASHEQPPTLERASGALAGNSP